MALSYEKQIIKDLLDAIKTPKKSTPKKFITTNQQIIDKTVKTDKLVRNIKNQQLEDKYLLAMDGKIIINEKSIINSSKKVLDGITDRFIFLNETKEDNKEVIAKTYKQESKLEMIKKCKITTTADLSTEENINALIKDLNKNISNSFISLTNNKFYLNFEQLQIKLTEKQLINTFNNCPKSLISLKNKSTDKNVLSKLFSLNLKEVNETISLNKNTAPSILRKIARTGSVIAKRNVATNKNSNRDTLFLLSYSKDIKTRINVANNKKTSCKVLERLAFDKDKVKLAVIHNRNISVNILRTIIKNSNSKISAIAHKVLMLRFILNTKSFNFELPKISFDIDFSFVQSNIILYTNRLAI